MTSPSLAPTWNEIVPAEPSSSLMPLKSAVLPMRSISDWSWAASAVIAALSDVRERAVLVLDGELTHALQHRVDLVQRALSRLHER